MKNERLIYSLCCPVTDEIHYVGKSTQGMRRPMQHLKESHSKKVIEWVEDLKLLNHVPKIKILEYVPLTEDLEEREKYWIQKSLNNGNLLLNDNSVTPLLINPNLDQIIGDSNNNTNLVIARFFKEKRKKVNLKQEEFAEKAGVALTVVRKVEQGKTNISLDGLLQMLRMFGCTIDIKKI